MPDDRATAALRLGLVLAYLLLAHLAGIGHAPWLAALALADIVVIVLLQPLLQRRAWAWLLLLAVLALLWPLVHSGHAFLPLLLVPVAILAAVSWTFGHTLLHARVPLITRMVAALEGGTPAQLDPEVSRYTRRLTAVWAGLLAALAATSLGLALVAVPNGILAGLGIAAPVAVTQAQWSWCANVLDYGVVGGFFVLEFAYRKRRFPGRYHNFADFLRRLAALGPQFWRNLLR